MKFHFRSYDHHHYQGGGGIVVPTAHPSALIVIDAHGRCGGGSLAGADFRSAEYGGEHGGFALDASLHRGECPHHHRRGGSPTDGSPASKRALHLEHHESECPVANPDSHSRPRSRQFFRLGRHRSRGIERADKSSPCCLTSDSSDDELGHCERTTQRTMTRRSRGIAGLRKPMLRRVQSLPIRPSTTTAANPSLTAPTKDCPSIQAIDAVASNSDDGLSSSKPASRHHRRHVTFTSVQIREYSTILGDHPCCPSGLPLSLGWELEREDSMEFETYEKEREPIRVKCKEEMRLGGEVRRCILRSLVTTSPLASGDEAIKSDSDEAIKSDSDEAIKSDSDEAIKSDNDEEHHDNGSEKTTLCCVYSPRDLCRAERRLTRERAGLNSRAHRRRTRGFFRPLTPEECEIGAAGVVAMSGDNDETAREDVKEVGSAAMQMEEDEVESCTTMDISPIKPPATR